MALTRSACCSSACSSSRRSRSCTSCCPSSPASRTPGTAPRPATPGWLIAAGGLEILSFGGYILLFRTVFVRGYDRIDWSASYQITMASLAATRLFAAAGAGGVVLTAWALRRSGMGRRLVACRMIAFLVLLYAVFMASLVIFGLGLRVGIFNGSAPFAVTVIPAIFGAAVISIALAWPSSRPTSSAGWTAGRAARTSAWPRSRGRWPPCPPRSRPACVRRSSSSASATGACSAPSSGGASTSRRCGRRSTPSAGRRSRPSRSSSWPTSSGSSATCCRCRAASAASTVA